MSDITYCGCLTCEHTECERHTDNCPPNAKQVSISAFTECEYWEGEINGQADIREREARWFQDLWI